MHKGAHKQVRNGLRRKGRKAQGSEGARRAQGERKGRAQGSVLGNKGGGAGPGDLTQWLYNDTTGVLTAKVDATGRSIGYAYRADGRLETLTRARNLDVGYTYNPLGELATTLFDGVLHRTHAYTRDGRMESVIEATGLRHDMDYDARLQLTDKTTTFDVPGDVQRVIGLSYGYETEGLPGRRNRVHAAPTGYDVGMTFRGTDGSISNLATAGGLVIAYRYGTNGAQRVGRVYRNEYNVPIMNETNRYGPGGLLASNRFWNWCFDTSRSNRYDVYGRLDRLGQGDDGSWHYTYNRRSEVTGAEQFAAGGTSNVPGGRFGYGYDHIGNRTNDTRDGATNRYHPNALNQSLSNDVTGTQFIVGEAAGADGVSVNGEEANYDGALYHHALATANAGADVYQDVTVTISNAADTVVNNEGRFFVPQTPESSVYDQDGNVLRDGRWEYTWNHENRLIEMKTRADLVSDVPRRKLDFGYDYQGRRVLKMVSNWNAGGGVYQEVSRSYFNYDGWNLVEEWAVTAGDVEVSHYVWGPDLSGSGQGAGGVGGLVASRVDDRDYVYTYAHNGNIQAMVDALTGVVKAEYEYDPFGTIIRQSGELAEANPFRFSTKYTDEETDLVYYGYRYYSPRLGQWFSLDHAEDEAFKLFNTQLGGSDNPHNLYIFINNSTINSYDYLGLAAEWHHELPQAARFARHWRRLNIQFHDAEFGFITDKVNHRTGVTSFERLGWPGDWDAFFARHPNATRRQVMGHLNTMRADPKYAQAYSSGVRPATGMKYTRWKNMGKTTRWFFWQRAKISLGSGAGRGAFGRTVIKIAPAISLVFIAQNVEDRGAQTGIVDSLFDAIPWVNWAKLGSECIWGDWFPEGSLELPQLQPSPPTSPLYVPPSQ